MSQGETAMNSPRKYIIAWTGGGTYPPFINISADAKMVRIYVRGKEALDNEGVSPGFATVIEIPIDEFRRIADEGLWLTRLDPRSCDEARLQKPEKYCRMGECEYAEHGFPPCEVWQKDHGHG